MGNAGKCAAAIRKETDHPHTRGERHPFRDCLIGAAGSSPHAWGTPRERVGTVHQCRIIPTRVGNAAWIYSDSGYKADHPHTRGERIETVYSAWFSAGSSPHAWGTLSSVHFAPRSRRIIPTRVGNAAASTRLWRCCPDHPHTRGERSCSYPIARCSSGSSPHAWGTLLSFCLDSPSPRIIPTRVGNARDRGAE